MIERIKEHLLNNWNFEDKFYSDWCAHFALQACEEAGMLPPVVIKNEIDPSNLFLNDEHYKWDSEDET